MDGMAPLGFDLSKSVTKVESEIEICYTGRPMSLGSRPFGIPPEAAQTPPDKCHEGVRDTFGGNRRDTFYPPDVTLFLV